MNSLISWLAARVSWNSVNVIHVGCTEVCNNNFENAHWCWFNQHLIIKTRHCSLGEQNQKLAGTRTILPSMEASHSQIMLANLTVYHPNISSYDYSWTGIKFCPTQNIFVIFSLKHAQWLPVLKWRAKKQRLFYGEQWLKRTQEIFWYFDFGHKIIGPMKGVFPTPDTGPFFSSDTDMQPKINVARHRHSELVTRHLTLHFSPTLTVSFPSRRRTLRKISSRRLTLRPPFMGPRGRYRGR